MLVVRLRLRLMVYSRKLVMVNGWIKKLHQSRWGEQLITLKRVLMLMLQLLTQGYRSLIPHKETVLNKVATAKQGKAAAADGDTSATITYKSGVQTYQAVFAAGDGTASAKYADKADVSNATATYTDADGEMTTIGSYTTKYSINL